MIDNAPAELGALLCRRAEIEVACNRQAGAQATLRRLEALASELSPLAASQLRAKITELERALGAR